MIFDANIGSGTVYPIFDKGTYSSLTYDSNTGNVSVVLTSPDADSPLGTFFLNTSAGTGSFTLTDGTTIALSSLAALHVTASTLGSEAALIHYLSGLGDTLSTTDLQSADFAAHRTIAANDNFAAMQKVAA